MPQKFNPDNVLLSDSLGKEVTDAKFTQEFLEQLVTTSKLVKLGSPVEMKAKMEKKSLGAGELSNAYFVGEGEKIGTAKFAAKDYVLEAKKIAVILPVSEEFLEYTWANYFNDVVPVIADKFNKMIDGAVFLGLHGNPFGVNVLASAKTAGNVITDDITTKTIYDLEALGEKDPTAFVGHRKINRILRGLVDNTTKAYTFDRSNKTLDGLAYEELVLADGEKYPDNTLLAGDFTGLKYGIPNNTQLRLLVANQATLSKVQNAGPDTGDVHLFEQDMQALRAVFEIAVAIPVDGAFTAIQKTASV
jgi:HK97 family phage major capsid protein